MHTCPKKRGLGVQKSSRPQESGEVQRSRPCSPPVRTSHGSSGCQHSARTSVLWPSRRATQAPVCVSHTLAVASSLPLSRRCGSSGDHSTEKERLACPCSECTRQSSPSWLRSHLGVKVTVNHDKRPAFSARSFRLPQSAASHMPNAWPGLALAWCLISLTAKPKSSC